MKPGIFLIAVLAAAMLSAALLGYLRQSPPATPAPFAIRDLSLPVAKEVPKDAVQPEPEEQEAPAPLPAPAALPAPATQSPAANIQPLLPPQSQTALPLLDQEFYARFAAAAVQIYCRTSKEIFAASGVIVNERGLVLTNAHVAEIATKAGEKNCQARHGNPASPFADLEIVFIADTATKIADTEVPQRDFAFLKIVEHVEPFAHATFDLKQAAEGESFLTLGYPSEFLQGVNAEANSNLVFSVLTVAGFSDLDGNRETAEAYVFRGGLALQQGSSGTAVFRRSGGVAGLIFATTKGATTADREGVALTTAYIDRILKLETGQGLAEFIAGH